MIEVCWNVTNPVIYIDNFLVFTRGKLKTSVPCCFALVTVQRQDFRVDGIAFEGTIAITSGRSITGISTVEFTTTVIFIMPPVITVVVVVEPDITIPPVRPFVTMFSLLYFLL